MTGDTDTERWMASVIRLSGYASALMRRRSLPGGVERVRAAVHPSVLIGDAADASLIAPMNEGSMPGISSSTCSFKGMATMLEQGWRPGMADLRRFARLHPDAAGAMLPACLLAEDTVRRLRATLDHAYDLCGYSDAVSGTCERFDHGGDTYATNIGTRYRPEETAACLSPAAMFAVHAARHLVAAPLLAPEHADDADICDMAATGWIPWDAVKKPAGAPSPAASDTAGAVLAAMGDDAWPSMPHIDPSALTWMMGCDMAPAIEAERGCVRWHAMADASPYDIAWASAAASGGCLSMDGHDMAVLCEAAGDLVIGLDHDRPAPVPVPGPDHIIEVSGIKHMKPMRGWMRLPYPVDADPDPVGEADGGAGRAYRMVAGSPAWPLAKPGIADMSRFLGSLDRPDADGKARAALGAILSGGRAADMMDRDGSVSAVKVLGSPVWTGMDAIVPLHAILMVETANGMVRGRGVVPAETAAEAVTMVGAYPDGFISEFIEAERMPGTDGHGPGRGCRR